MTRIKRMKTCWPALSRVFFCHSGSEFCFSKISEIRVIRGFFVFFAIEAPSFSWVVVGIAHA